MSASSPISLAAVAGQQQRSRATDGRRAVLPFQLYDENSASNCRVDLLDIECDLDDAPPLIWDSDTSSDDIPSYLEWAFEETLASRASVFASEDEDEGSCSIDMTPESTLYQQDRPFDYKPFSEPWFPSKVRLYPDELTLSMEENYLFHDLETGIFGRCSDVLPSSPMATFSIADSAADTFLITFERPINIGFPLEEGSANKSGRMHEDFDQKIIYLGDL